MRGRNRARRLAPDAAEALGAAGAAPSQELEDEELLQEISGALQDFLDHGDPEGVGAFLLSFFHRVGKAAGVRAEDLIAEFTGERKPLRQVADANGYSVPTAWRRLGSALQFLQDALHARALSENN